MIKLICIKYFKRSLTILTLVMNEHTSSSQSSHWTEVVGQLMECLPGKNMSMNYEFDVSHH